MAGWKKILTTDDVDDTPVDSATSTAISSNWAYDHENDADPHTQYLEIDGTDAMTGTLNMGGYGITGISTGFQSSVDLYMDIVTAGRGEFTFKNTEGNYCDVDIQGNLSISGTVDGIDIATDVAANTSARHAQAHAMDTHSDFTEDSPAEAELVSYDATAEEWTNRTLAEAGVQPTITGAATTIDTEDLTASRALASSAGGKVEVSLVTATELGYLDGVTSAIQTQLDVRRPIPVPYGFAQRNTDTGDGGWDREGLNSTYPGYRGHIMETTGSIVSMSARIYIPSAVTTPGTLRLRMTFGHDSSPTTALEVTFAIDTGDEYEYLAEQAIANVGTHEFAAGDVIALYAYYEDGLVCSYRQGDCTFHVVYDDDWWVT
jgi:hypothetical protein